MTLSGRSDCQQIDAVSVGKGAGLIWINLGIVPQRKFVFMTIAEERARKCLAHAEQCKAWAELASRESAKEQFLKLAAEWDALAAEIAEIEKMKIFTAKAGNALRQL